MIQPMADGEREPQQPTGTSLGGRVVVGRAGSRTCQSALGIDAPLLVSLTSKESGYYTFGLISILHYDQ